MVSELHIADPDKFKERLEAAKRKAEPWTEMEKLRREQARAEAFLKCKRLAKSIDILEELNKKLKELGLAGERLPAKIIYLATTSRLLDRPVSAVIKGPSAGGKSFVAKQVLRLIPPEAVDAFTSMSEHSLLYSTKPLKHRCIVIYEASGLSSDFTTYIIRSLLSEGCIDYRTVVKGKHGPEPKDIHIEGPTGLIVTTTKLALDPELETRLLSLTITDTPAQTERVFDALADRAKHLISEPDVSEWHALQTWLALGPNQVIVPFADTLALLFPPLAVRLRRDFGAILELISTNALLHQANRQTDDAGRIIAEVQDYEAVWYLLTRLVSASVEATVPIPVRNIVEAIRALIAVKVDEEAMFACFEKILGKKKPIERFDVGDLAQALKRDKKAVVAVVAKVLGDKKHTEEIGYSDITKAIRLDKAAVSRRVVDAAARGFIKNLEDKRGLPARLVLADRMPSEDVAVLPDPTDLEHELELLRREGS